MNISMKKQQLMRNRNEPITASKSRIDAYCKNKNRNVSNAVISTPRTRGIPKRMFNAIAVPNISCLHKSAFAI